MSEFIGFTVFALVLNAVLDLTICLTVADGEQYVQQSESAYIIATQQKELVALARYPTFSLFGAGGSESIDASTLFDAESMAVRAGLMVNWTLFDSRRTNALLVAAGESQIQATLAYRATVLGVLEEVESATARYVEAVRSHKANEDRLATHNQFLTMVLAKAEAGTRATPDILDATIARSEARMQANAAEEQLAITRISLNKALGP